jgi:hypothetical protein
MKHYDSTYVVHTTIKPKYIRVAHTTLHEAIQYICSAHNNKAKVLVLDIPDWHIVIRGDS